MKCFDYIDACYHLIYQGDILQLATKAHYNLKRSVAIEKKKNGSIRPFDARSATAKAKPPHTTKNRP